MLPIWGPDLTLCITLPFLKSNQISETELMNIWEVEILNAEKVICVNKNERVLLRENNSILRVLTNTYQVAIIQLEADLLK